MKQFLTLVIVFFFCLSCKTKTGNPVNTSIKDRFLSLVPDTTKNFRAQWDLEDLKYRIKLEQQIGLKDLTQGADSLEVRLWYDFSMGIAQELYILRIQDTFCNLSYHRIYPKRINYDDENRNREWNPYKDPIIDSSVSRSVLLIANEYKNLHLDSIWFLKSQSELKINEKIGFTDCNTYIIEIADKKRFKYFRHHCAMGYYDQTKLKEIVTFMDFCNRITALTQKHNAIVPYNYD
jgi:hypothetical protein